MPVIEQMFCYGGDYMKRVFTALIIVVFVVIFTLRGSITVQGVDESALSDRKICYSTYQVKSGDSIWEIAEEYHHLSNDDLRTYVDNLLKINHISDARSLRSGSVISLYYCESEGESSIIGR